jgi:hypothetical protein
MEPLYVKRKGAALVPCSLSDEEALFELPEGKELKVTLSRQRSSRQHRFFWALLQKVCTNHETYHKPDQLLLWLKVRLGYVEQVHFHGDQFFWTTKSISFKAMPQDEFRKFFDAAMDCIVTEIIPGMAAEDLIHEVEEMLGFSLNDIWKEKRDGV